MVGCCTWVLLIVGLILIYPAEEKFPCVKFRAQPLVTLGGSFCRRGGSTGPTGGASTIPIPYYLKKRTGPEIHPYGSRKSVGSSVLQAFFASNACLARDEPSSRRVGGVGLSRKPQTQRSKRCAQPRAAKARAAGVAAVGEMASITRATAVFAVSCTTCFLRGSS